MKIKNKNKTALFTYLCLFVLFNLSGLFGLYLLDSKTGFRIESWDDNWLSQLLGAFRVPRIDFSIRSTTFFIVAYIATLILIASFIFRRAFLKKAKERDIPAKKFHIVYFCTVGAIFVLCWVCTLVYFIMRTGGLKHLLIMAFDFFFAAFLFLFFVLIIYMFIWTIVNMITAQAGRPATIAAEPISGAQTEPPRGGTESDAPEKEIFPGLNAIDKRFARKKPEAVEPQAPCSLSDLAEGFQAFLSERCSLYYDLPLLRSFIAGMATSRLIILEGLSGTGKSSLPRYFAEYVGSQAFFAPVQSTWRDRTDVLGFYNDFSGVFKETNFLKRLYEASYTPAKFNLMVLDEMNLSRVEYYFADFLSVMEYPSDSWKIPLVSHVPEFESPKKLSDGEVVVPVNTWFIGTANKDDSTFTITDKVYDRAVVIEFNERNTKIVTSASSEPLSLAPAQLYALFEVASRNTANRMTPTDIDKFAQLTQFVYDAFDVQFGNRIMNQIYAFVPVYVALGGTKEEAVDIMFSKKILHKLEGRFEDYVKDGLLKLQTKITSIYGPDVMISTESMIRLLLKKLL